MSIDKKNTGNQDTPQTAMGQAFKDAGMAASPQATAATRNEPAAAPSQTQTKSNSTMDINSFFKRDVSRSGLSGSTSMYLDAFRKLQEKLSDSVKQQYQIFSVEGVGTHFASIVITKAYSQGGTPVVAAYTYQIEASAQKLPARQIQHAGQTFSLPTAPGDAIDGVLWEKIENFLRSTFGDSARVFNAGAQPIYSDTLPGDELKIAMLFRQAIDATSTTMVINKVVQETPLDAKLLVTGGQPLTGVDTNPPALFDIQGNPIRSDFRIVTRKTGEQQNAAVWNPNSNNNKDLVATDVYIDLDYSPVQPTSPYGAAAPQQYGFGQPAPTWKYVPRAVITNIESLTEASTPELLGLGLGQAIVLSRRNFWLQAFAPRWPTGKGKGEVANLRDATAIGFEVNLTGDTKPARLPHPTQAETQQYYAMLASAISPNLLYSVDIDEAGDNTWLIRDLYLAAHNNPEAKARIIQAFNNLTDGKFAALYDQSQPMVIDEVNRVPLGYWLPAGPTGPRADIRQLDYVAMLNIVGESDMKLLQEWSATFWDINTPMEIRLERRDRISRELLPGYTLRGHARRMVLGNHFLGAIVKSLEASGLLLQSNDALVDLTGQTVRGNFTTANQALDFNALGATGMFGSNLGQAQQFRGAVGNVGFGGLGR